MAFPATVFQQLPSSTSRDLASFMGSRSWPYIIGEGVLIFLFTFFYVAVIFNSIEQADNLEVQRVHPRGAPGRPTASTLSACSCG